MSTTILKQAQDTDQHPNFSAEHLDQLTDSQREAHDQLLNFCTRKTDYHAALLVGYAGTGKSFCVSRLVQSIRQMHREAEIAVAAPTHKAVRVLKREAMAGVSYATIHSLLALKEHRDGDKITFAPDRFRTEPPPISRVDYLLLDEVSMLNGELYRMLLPYINQGLKVIFIGDAAQIPPVGEIDSIPLMKWKELGILRCELSQIMRQAEGNPVLEFATEIRSNYKTGRFNPSRKLLPDGSGIETVLYDSPREQEILEKYFDCQQFTDDPDYMKVIAWRNVIVDTYNRKIRHIIHKQENLPAILPREKLIIEDPVMRDGRMILARNEEVVVEKASVTDYELRLKDIHGDTVPFSLQTYLVTLSWMDDDVRRTCKGHIVHESAMSSYHRLMDFMQDAARKAPTERRGKMWQQWYQTREKFLWVSYNYAITAHKSQGSSYQQCLVLKWDIDLNRNIEERNRILYVACTRPRHTLFIEP